MFGARAKRKRELHAVIDDAWKVLADRRKAVEKILGPIAQTVVGHDTGSFEAELDHDHGAKPED